MNKKIPEIQSLKDFVLTYPHLVTQNQMRNYIARRKKNGADVWIHRIGRRMFINVENFFEWTKRKC